MLFNHTHESFPLFTLITLSRMPFTVLIIIFKAFVFASTLITFYHRWPSLFFLSPARKNKRMNSRKTFVINSELELLFLWREKMNTDIYFIADQARNLCFTEKLKKFVHHKRQTTFNMQRIYYSLASFYPRTFEHNKRLNLPI